jgi:hypothetical protein
MDAFVALVFVSAFAICELGIILILLSRPKKPTMSVQHIDWPQPRWPGGKQQTYE